MKEQFLVYISGLLRFFLITQPNQVEQKLVYEFLLILHLYILIILKPTSKCCVTIINTSVIIKKK